MNSALQTKVVDLSFQLLDLVPHRFRHFSYVARRNKIVAFGVNRPFKTHPLANKFATRFRNIHSETDVIRRFPLPMAELRKHTLINVRIGCNGKLTMSRPCGACTKLLAAFGVTDIFFSTKCGDFQAL